MRLIQELGKYGTVLTEHIGDKTLSALGESVDEKFIFERDMQWVGEADVVVAEVSTPSLGVGYEIGQAQAIGKPILCLYRDIEGKKLSAMIRGNDYVKVSTYTDIESVNVILAGYFSK